MDMRDKYRPEKGKSRGSFFFIKRLSNCFTKKSRLIWYEYDSLVHLLSLSCLASNQTISPPQRCSFPFLTLWISDVWTATLFVFSHPNKLLLLSLRMPQNTNRLGRIHVETTNFYRPIYLRDYQFLFSLENLLYMVVGLQAQSLRWFIMGHYFFFDDWPH